MATLALIGLVLLQSPSLKLEGQFFQIETAGDIESVPVQVEQPPIPSKVAFRKDDAYAVWDSRGLTLRRGKRSHSTRMEDVSLSPKLFSKSEIEETKKLIKSGVRKKGAEALSGSIRIGAECFFLLQWKAKKGEPWLEALVRTNLEDESIKPEFLGAFQGRSLNRGKVGQELFTTFGLVASIVRTTKGEWGLASYQPANGEFAFKPYGSSLKSFDRVSPRIVVFREQTNWGTVLVGRVDLGAERRKVLMEGRVSPTILTGDGPTIAYWKDGKELVARNLDTGSERRFPADIELRRTEFGVLAFRSITAPKEATLYNPERWTAVVRWGLPQADGSGTADRASAL